jgi:hypothetical protein
VVVLHVPAEVPGIERHRREYHARSTRVHCEALAAAATEQQVALATLDVVVVGGIEREDHAQLPLGTDPEHHQVAVITGDDLHLRPVAGEVLALVAQRDTDRRIGVVRGHADWRDCDQGKQDRVEHGALGMLNGVPGRGPQPANTGAYSYLCAST